jgi:multidrug efflux pump subunit AcrB
LAAAISASRLPPGTRIEETTAIAELARARLGTLKELKQVYSSIGACSTSAIPTKTGIGETRKATLMLDWGEAKSRDTQPEGTGMRCVRTLADVPGVRISFLSTEPGELMQLVLSGDDSKALSEAAAASNATCARCRGLAA